MEEYRKTLSNMANEKCPILGHRSIESKAAEWALNEIDRLTIAHNRYETARRLTPQQWAAIYDLNLKTGYRFDEIIDNMRPFMFPKNEANT